MHKGKNVEIPKLYRFYTQMSLATILSFSNLRLFPNSGLLHQSLELQQNLPSRLQFPLPTAA